MNETHESTRRTSLVYLNPTPTAPGDARRFIEDILDLHPAVESAKLIISELVTNAVLHGGRDAGRITVTVDKIAGTSGDSIRLEVSQPHHAGFEFDDQDAGHMDSSGRGLMIVEAVAEEWGFDRANGSVWAIIA
jgi:anti-sigma regulatory factor (Ser/Thr protein kinase)